jgi:hypothetical protein
MNVYVLNVVEYKIENKNKFIQFLKNNEDILLEVYSDGWTISDLYSIFKDFKGLLDNVVKINLFHIEFLYGLPKTIKLFNNLKICVLNYYIGYYEETDLFYDNNIKFCNLYINFKNLIEFYEMHQNDKYYKNDIIKSGAFKNNADYNILKNMFISDLKNVFYKENSLFIKLKNKFNNKMVCKILN